MIRRVSLYIASRFCEWRAAAALKAHRKWLSRAEKFFLRLGGG